MACSKRLQSRKIYQFQFISHTLKHEETLWSKWVPLAFSFTCLAVELKKKKHRASSARWAVWKTRARCYLEFWGRSFLNRPPTDMSTLITMATPSIRNTLPTIKPDASNINLGANTFQTMRCLLRMAAAHTDANTLIKQTRWDISLISKLQQCVVERMHAPADCN